MKIFYFLLRQHAAATEYQTVTYFLTECRPPFATALYPPQLYERASVYVSTYVMMYSYMHARNRHKFSYKINTMEINSRHLVRHAGSGYRLVRRASCREKDR